MIIIIYIQIVLPLYIMNTAMHFPQNKITCIANKSHKEVIVFKLIFYYAGKNGNGNGLFIPSILKFSSC